MNRPYTQDNKKTNVFVAMLPSHDHRQQITQKIYACEAKRSSQLRIHWTFITDLHATLGFLSGIEIPDIQTLSRSFQYLTQATKFMATVKDVRIYGNAIVLRLEPYQTFLGLHQKLKQALQGYQDGKYHLKEQTRYDPHLTIGRIHYPRMLNDKLKHQLVSMISEPFTNTSLLIQQAALMQRLPTHVLKTSNSPQTYQVLQGYMFK